MQKVWEWLKKNWKWILFPIGILVFLGSFFTTRAILGQFAEPPSDLDEKTRTALKNLRKADLVRDQKIAELEQTRHQRLKELTEEQQKELEELKDKSLEEVVTWFDNL